MKELTKKDICNAVLLAGYIALFWYVVSFFPVAFDWAASWFYKITGSRVAVIISGALFLMVFSIVYAFAKIQGEFFGPIKKIEKKRRISVDIYHTKSENSHMETINK